MAGGFDDLAIFVSVARSGSFIGAAKALSLPTSTVSRRLAALESRLNTQLIRRTTRAISLTEDGRALAERCAPALEEIKAASASLADNTGELRGGFRVTAPTYVCPNMLGSWLLEFAASHPGLVLDLRLTNADPDLVEESIDLSFQVGPLRAQRHVARRLWPVRYVLCAARSTVESRPGLAAVAHPRDLADYPCVVTPPLDIWLFERPGRDDITVAPRLLAASSDDWAVGAAAVKRGMGIGYLPEALVGDALGGDLVEIDLDGWRPKSRDLFAVYPASRQLSPKVRAAIEFALKGRTVHGARARDIPASYADMINIARSRKAAQTR
jgi:DNA-binding transcriptional LysR family regulator